MTQWVDTFAKVFATRAQTSDEMLLKEEYIQWVQGNGTLYASVAKQVPVLFELLNSIEEAIKVQVKIEPAKEPKKDK